MKKTVVLLLAATILTALLLCAGCGADTAVPRVITLKGPTGMGMAYLMKEQAEDYTFALAAEPTEVQAALIAGQADIAALPLNLAAVLSNKGEDIRFAAINTLGVLHLLENGDSVTSLSDLRGKTIYATGKGSTPQYVLEYLLTKAGIDPAHDVTIEYLTEHAELATKLAANDAAIGMLPEPNVTVALTTAAKGGNAALRVALDLTEEWNRLGEGELAQGCIAVRGAFWDEHPEAVERFLRDYARSVERVNASPAEAAELIASFGIVPSAALAEKAIPNCHIVCITGDDGAALAEANLSVLFAANPKSIGGVMPKREFYGK